MKLSAVALSVGCLLVAGCPSKTEPVAKKAEPKPVTPPPAKPVEAPAKADAFAQFLKGQKKWSIVPEDRWLAADYVAQYNKNPQIKKKIAYAENTVVRGDFNGDQREDVAAIVLDPDDVAYIMAFHRTDTGFDPVTIEKNWPVTQCCYGAGLAAAPPGQYAGKTLKHHGIIMSVYEKSDMLISFDGKAYTMVQLAD